MNTEDKFKIAPDTLSGFNSMPAKPEQDSVPQLPKFKQENKLPDADSISFSSQVPENLAIAKSNNREEPKTSAPSAVAPKILAKDSLKPQPVKELPAHTKFIDKFILIVVLYFVCLLFLHSIDGIKLSIYSAMSNLLSPGNYVETQADYADYFGSIGQYDKSASIYLAVIERIKSTRMNSQLLSLTELKLANSLLNSGDLSKSKQASQLVEIALSHIGNPDQDTPKGLVETLRSLGEKYTNKNEPYIAYPLVEAASRFWKTGPTTQSEGNTYADLGECFENKGDWQLVYQCYAHAYSITKSWGDADYNVYRLGKMGLAKNNLGQIEEATQLFKQAIKMDERIHKNNLDWSEIYASTYISNLVQMQKTAEAEAFVKNHPHYKNTLQAYQKSKQQLSTKNTHG